MLTSGLAYKNMSLQHALLKLSNFLMAGKGKGEVLDSSFIKKGG